MLRGVGFCEVPRGWDVVMFLWGRYINMSIFVDFNVDNSNFYSLVEDN